MTNRMKAVTAEQMRDIDFMSEREYRVTSLALMENAGRAIAEEALKMLKGGKGRAAILCGRGNNGGDGIAAACELKKKGVEVKIYAVDPGERQPKPEVRAQKERAAKENLTIHYLENPEEELPHLLLETDLIIDALLGTGSKGKPAGPVQKAIQKIMKAGKPILAVDIPSGIDADTGYHSGVFIQATKTVTLGLPKTGLLKPHAQKNVGELIVADIGHPAELLKPYK